MKCDRSHFIGGGINSIITAAEIEHLFYFYVPAFAQLQIYDLYRGWAGTNRRGRRCLR
jgi:hypothetical protein